MAEGVVQIRRAILAPYDKGGLVDLARALVGMDVELVASGGTARVLGDAGIPVTPVETLIGVLGRVGTSKDPQAIRALLHSVGQCIGRSGKPRVLRDPLWRSQQ